MSIRKRNNRWQVRVKYRGEEVSSRTFDRKKEAEVWETQQKRLLANSEWTDPSAGRESLASAWRRWSESRKHEVSESALDTDDAAFRKLPDGLKKRPLESIRSSDFSALYGKLLGTMARASVQRYRTSYGAFFSWLLRERVIHSNPATMVKVPKGAAARPARDIYPFTAEELRAVSRVIGDATNQTNADIVLLLGLTGLRWGELAALRVRDFQEVPIPSLLVRRSKSDGKVLRTTTKGGNERSVPLVAEAKAIVERQAVGKSDPEELLFATSTGGFLSLASWKRGARWGEHSLGRSVKDLRHTYATCLLRLNTDLKTVQKWLGHASAKLTADTYAHWMGSNADRAEIERLNKQLASTSGSEGLPGDYDVRRHK